MRSRAAILPFPGDPFLLHYWLENFYAKWSDEITKLYIICNTPAEAKVVEYLEFLCTEDPDKIDYTFIDHHIQHGDAIRIGLEKATEEFVMLVEDDAYIIKQGTVDRCFYAIESGQYDIVAGKRGSCDREILIAAQNKYGLAYEGEGDQGPNFWPNYFFSRRELLLATDRDYNSRAWVQGDKIAPLGDYEVVAPVIASDTFVSTSLQLRAMVPEARICYMNQYHGHPDDYKHFEEHRYLFDGQAPWCHIGSLSSGVSGAIMDDQGRSIAKRKREEPHGPTVLPSAWCDINSDFSKMEWERRVQWWLTFWERRDPAELVEYADLYKKGLDRIIQQFQLREKRIIQRQAIYKTLGL
jgi:hypothetical protein